MSTGGRSDKEVGGAAGTEKYQEGHGGGWEKEPPPDSGE